MATEQPLILLADDHEDALYGASKMLSMAGFRTISAANGSKAYQAISEQRPDIALLDVMMPEMDGLALTKILKADPELRYIPVILLSAKDSLNDIVDGLEAGADGYITKPFKPDELIARVKAALRTRVLYEELKKSNEVTTRLVTEVSRGFSLNDIIGESQSIKVILDLVKKVASADSSVLISGKSGTGKELIAKALHFLSNRKTYPFIAKNCAAFSGELLESQLFGHLKGSFTGAIKDQQGIFEAANGGTLFLDELGEMPLDLQAKLLRVLQEGTFMPLGSNQEKTSDVRVIAATNRNLEEMVREGKFREDLYYRLNVIHIELPNLNERKEDIPLLVTHFLDRSYQKKQGQRKQVTKEVLDILVTHDWPGNIRELENELERMIILSGDSNQLGSDLLSNNLKKVSKSIVSKNITNTYSEADTLKEAVSDLEKNMISQALARTKGNKSTAAKELGISRSSLIAKVQEFKLEE